MTLLAEDRHPHRAEYAEAANLGAPANRAALNVAKFQIRGLDDSSTKHLQQARLSRGLRRLNTWTGVS